MSSSTDFNEIKEIMVNNKDLFEVLINILLVWHGARNASLIETANFNNNKSKIEEIYKFIRILETKDETKHLYITYDQLSVDRFPRYFITTSELKNIPDKHEDIGKLLGFFCYDHDYGNYMEDRLSIQIIANVGNIEEYQVYVEVCEIHKSNKNKLKDILSKKISNYNKAMQSIGFNIVFYEQIEVILGLKTLFKKVKDGDIDFIHQNINEYNNYFDNFGFEIIHSYVLKNFDTKQKLIDNFHMFHYLMLFTKPYNDISLLNRYLETQNDIEYVIEFLEKLDPNEVDEKNFENIVEEIIF